MRGIQQITATIGAALVAGTMAASTPALAGSATAQGHRPGPRLVDSAPCKNSPGFHCSTLRAPLDHSGEVSGTLDLSVATADNVDAPRGVLLFLAGGPGQPGVSLLPRIVSYLDPKVRRDYRLVVLDQRGTGPKGINCAALQASTGGSDFLTPPAADIRACARQLGSHRAFYRTTDTVDDLDLLRRAVGARRLAIDGVSYGTYVASQYALKNPGRVSALVLDSVVPSRGIDPLGLDWMRATEDVLRKACRRDAECTTDPVADLAWVARNGIVDGRRINPTRLIEALGVMSLSTVNPSFKDIPAILHQARTGDTAPLGRLMTQVSSVGTPYDALSAGLHANTLCADLSFPWGRSDAPMQGRSRALDRVMGRVTAADTYPYPRSTPRKMFAIKGCQNWLPSRPSADVHRAVLAPRTLIVQGSNDLFCPVGWARWQHRHSARSKLVVIDGGGHGTQGSEVDPTARNAVRSFLTAGQPRR